MSSISQASASTRERIELRNFGLLVGTMFAGVFGLLLPLLRRHQFPAWPWMLCAVLVIGALGRPAALRPLYVLWTALGRLLGWVNQRIVLTVTFYLMVAPMGFVLRVLRRDPMARRFDPEADSYRLPSRATPARGMERPF